MLHSIKIGTGNKHLIFVHGNSQSAESWLQIINDSALKEYTNLALDLPGHGQSYRSQSPAVDYSLKGLAKCVDEFLKPFETNPFVLIGLSLGTNVITELTGVHNNCKGVVLISADIMGKNLQVTDILKPNPNLAACFTEYPTEDALKLLIDDCVYLASDEQKTEIRKDFLATDPLFRSNMAACIGAQDYSDELLAIENRNIPIAVVFGDQEKLVFTDYLDKVLFKKWKNKTILIPNSGHCIQYDQPTALANIIAEFAKEVF